MMLGLLLARAGVSVIVLEKHQDFLRDFRGDTLHPSTLEVMHELGVLERLLQLPHQKVPRLNGRFGDLAFTVADFSHLPTRAATWFSCRSGTFSTFWLKWGDGIPRFRFG
jgi:2-polyprenyl-6-methoxyphenol hydroxylase-like FAD-dependent oxidoreductase